jgi:hypothetical protein
LSKPERPRLRQRERGVSMTLSTAAADCLAQQWRMGVQDQDGHWQDTQAAPRDIEHLPARRDSTPVGPPDRARSFPLALILAVVVGIAVASISVHAYLDWRARVALEETVRANTEAARQARLKAEQQQREEAARQQLRQAELDQQEALRLQAIRDRQSADEAARKAVTAEADRKEKAWAKFYRKPASCNDAATLECANGYIRAKRAFEEKYARGEL